MILVPFAGQQEVKECGSTPVKIGLSVSEAVGAPGKLWRRPAMNWRLCIVLYAEMPPCSAIFRRVIFPFTGKFQGSPLAYSVDVEGFANMARQAVLDILSAEHPGMAIDLSDIRLFYTDIDGDQIEIVSDVDICFAIREHTYKLCGKNLRITSPLIKEEGHKGHASVTVAAKVFKVSPGTSPSASPILGAHTEAASASMSTTEIEESGLGSSPENTKEAEEPIDTRTPTEAGQAAKGALPTSVGPSPIPGMMKRSTDISINPKILQCIHAQLQMMTEKPTSSCTPPPSKYAMNPATTAEKDSANE
jgi:hypothetical protein